MRKIDADALIDKYGDWYTEEGTEEGYIGTIKGIVDSMPTIESEWKRGKWIEDRCSECGCYVYHGDVRNFCPMCGADMREDQDE